MTDEAIPAATLIVVRDQVSGPPELLMVERAGGMAFAAGALVFPGGRIDEADRQLAETLKADAARVAAIRETVEETAIAVGLAPVPSEEQALELQRDLVADASFADLLEAHGLGLDVAELTPFARWVPKFHAVRRFDTMFFVARAPVIDWQPQVIEGECAGAAWVTASDVLEREKRGEARLIFPTRRTLERLAQHRSFDEIRADADSHRIEPISPWVENVDGEKFITIPADLGFPVTQEHLDGLWRG
ncbi:NUDIX domain-containing protein [Sphingomonas sp. URHD0057]|uniref:NUDIX domain-containing protein n=1 Tax=Sphingomonas sp. URHD0057 TaxID=1380389 RepID=UPI00049044FC|nr:NUDIX domain-containing protein [Sphingomonas sp. URHD0057]